MEKRFWIILGVIIVILVGVFIFTAPKNKSNNNSSTDLKNNGNLNTVQSYDHVRGSSANKVILVEYGDFQCPYCGAYYPYAGVAFQRYSSVVTFVYRDFPLTQIHPNAFAADRAAEAAAKQGKFWQMYDKLYQNQNAWADNTLTASDTFATYAQQIGLNMNQYKSDYASEDVNNTINTFLADGKNQNVQGTPTLYLIVNGKSQTVQPPQNSDSAQAFYQTLETAIKQAGLKVPQS